MWRSCEPRCFCGTASSAFLSMTVGAGLSHAAPPVFGWRPAAPLPAFSMPVRAKGGLINPNIYHTHKRPPPVLEAMHTIRHIHAPPLCLAARTHSPRIGPALTAPTRRVPVVPAHPYRSRHWGTGQGASVPAPPACRPTRWHALGMPHPAGRGGPPTHFPPMAGPIEAGYDTCCPHGHTPFRTMRAAPL